MIRMGLIEEGEEDYVLVVDMHHIISDGVSMDIFQRELMDLYEGRELPPLRIQYKDYAEWRSREEGNKSLKEQEAYWLETFEGEIPLLNLPVDYARPVVQSFEGKIAHFELTPVLTAALKKLAREENATLFMVLAAVFNILPAKLSGQEDIVVGIPAAGRLHPDLEDIIGMFVNTLALRNHPTGDKNFKEFLRELKTNTLKAFENQEYQFEDLVELLKVKRDAGRNPLFDIMF
ncbi:MAG: hypothetical protein GY950_04420, partial [bacterium]|nr:hypothetical protein [bacterium]